MEKMIEVEDGLLSTPNKVLMKARCPELFPDYVKEYINNAEKVQNRAIEIGLEKVKVRAGDKLAVFDKKYFEYIKGLGLTKCYLSSVPLPGNNPELYPLVVKYKHGWCVLAPLEV